MLSFFFHPFPLKKYDAENFDPGLVIRGRRETALTAATPPHPGLEEHRAEDAHAATARAEAPAGGE